jgi:DMSO/TMAO reductase YedYZ heme-binding membrane subunit
MCVLGLLFRRPPRRRGRVHPETLLRTHTALGPAVCALVATHIISLLADRYSGVRWPALLLPDAAKWRPGAVTYGMFATVLLVVIVLTAAMAGRRPVGARWAILHRLSYPCFALVWVHGVLAGSDTTALEGLYVAVGVTVGLAAMPQFFRQSAVAKSGTAS